MTYDQQRNSEQDEESDAKRSAGRNASRSFQRDKSRSPCRKRYPDSTSYKGRHRSPFSRTNVFLIVITFPVI